jgi:ParB-like nuclease domain
LRGDYRSVSSGRVGGRFTMRSHTTQGSPNDPVRDLLTTDAVDVLKSDHGVANTTDLPTSVKRSLSGYLASSLTNRLETRQELMDRKVREAETRPEHGQHGDSLYRRPGQKSMAQSIAESGVQSPVFLATMDSPESGFEGKPEIFGGHHRIATAAKYAPDRLIPVIYEAGFRDAWSHPYYK